MFLQLTQLDCRIYELMLSKTVIVFDNLKDTLFLIVHADTEQSNAYEDAQQKLDQLEQLLATPVSLQAKPHTPPHFESITGKAKFLETVEKVKEYIRAGDVMQVVPGSVWFLISMGRLYRFIVLYVI